MRMSEAQLLTVSGITESLCEFTVFTATYNRSHTLPAVHAALNGQTYRGFEWLIVDDGSSDGTSEIVRSWQETSDFSIRYFYQPNGGKHRATNLGVREARGKYFLILDSDDTCVPHALETFKRHWDELAEPDGYGWSTITVLAMDPNGDVVGPRFPAPVVDVRDSWEQLVLRSRGERWGANRTDVLRAFPFPEVEGERFIPESVVWNRMARKYATRFIDEPLRVYAPRGDGLTAAARANRIANPKGATIVYGEMLALDLPWRARLRTMVNFLRFSIHARSVDAALRSARGAARALTWSCLPAAALLALSDRRTLRS